ncbi:major capsid protein [Niveispirillum fermenti]|uniref:major capsid protein n=1 Tax=Niveispirillum fermenti TaxID=1233113 RepID=UPI003A8B4E9C
MRNVSIPDIVNGRPFSPITLTDHINQVPFVPGFLGSLGSRLFSAEGVVDHTVAMTGVTGTIDIIATSARGSPAHQGTNPKQGLLPSLPVAHIKKERTATADEIQAALTMAAMTGEPEFQSIQGLLFEQMEGPFGLRQEFNLTHEYHRLGGIQGLVLDKDGSPLYDWYDYFSVAAPADVEINFSAFTAEDTDFEQRCIELSREITLELNGLPFTGMTLMSLCHSGFYDRVRNNKEVVFARRNRDMGKEGDVFVGGVAFKSFRYGGITWVDYQGTPDGKVGIAQDTARLFPVDVPGLFRQLYGPPDVIGYTRIKGPPIFSFMPPSRQTERMMTQEAQSNVLTVCTRPMALRKLVLGAPST